MTNINKILVGKTAIVGCIIAGRAFGNLLSANASIKPTTRKTFVDVTTRNTMRGVSASRVQCIRLSGINMGNFGQEPQPAIEVTNPQLIHVFVGALKSATTNSTLRLGDGVDTLEVVLKKTLNRQREQVVLPFNAQRTGMWYGSKFKAALNQLANFQATRVRQQTAPITLRQLQRAQLGKIVLSDRGQLRLLLQSLQHVDSQAFAYTSPTRTTRASSFETLHLTLQYGKEVKLRFVPDRFAPNAVMRPLWKIYDADV